MQRRTVLASTDAFEVADVRCTEMRCRTWSSPERMDRHTLVHVRRGVFTRRVRGREMFVDPTVVYLEEPECEQQVAHPLSGGDVCTSIRISPTLLASVMGDDLSFRCDVVPTTAHIDMEHRLLVTALARGDVDGEIAERVVRLVALVATEWEPERVQSGRPSTEAAHRRLVNEARVAINEDPTIGLIPLSRLVGSSPHHLSRIFSRHTGKSISQYRLVLRVRRALNRLARGEADLASLAIDVGFADHAHLTRTIHAATGDTPSTLRRILAVPR